jgi:imidazolonepropionase-like amidohydrolase
VDVRRGTIVPSATVIVRNGSIESIQQQTPPTGVRILNLADHYLLPGLIDVHTHIDDLDAGRRALESGVTTIRSAEASAYNDVALRDLSTRAAVAVPDVLAAGYGLRPQLPLNAFLASPAYWDLESGLRGPDTIRRAVRMNTARKVDWIKIFVTEGLDGDPSRMQFTETDIVATVEEATASGIPVEAHALGDEGARAAIRAGVRSIEHGSYMTDTTLALMNDKNVYFVPTLRRLATIPDNAPPAVRSRVLETLPAAHRTIQQARKIGVRIVTGTDSNYGRPNANLSVGHKVAELVGIGLTPIEALRSATIIGAEMQA